MLRCLTVVIVASLLFGCATQAATSGRIVLQDQTTPAAVSINSHDRALIGEYYGSKRKKGMPPGLAKRGGDLPPGLAKRETLPPGLQREPLPFDLERQLSVLPSGYVRVRVGRDIALLDNRTHALIDAVYGVAF